MTTTPPLAPDPARGAARPRRRRPQRHHPPEAIEALAALRTPYWLGDTAVHLHALASLIAQAQRLLPDAIDQARDQELTWDEIGLLLGVSGSDRRTPLPAPDPHTHGDLTHAHHADHFSHRPRRLQHALHRSRCQG